MTNSPRIEIRQYRPAFFSGFETETWKGDTWEALLESSPHLQRLQADPEHHQWSVSDEHLMHELNGGAEFWVIGTILRGLDVIGLPAWIAPPDDEDDDDD